MKTRSFALPWLTCLCLGVLCSPMYMASGRALAADVTVYDILPGPSDSSGGPTANPIDVNGVAFFAADGTDDFNSDSSLWRAAPGDSLATLLANGCNPAELTDVNGVLFFICEDDMGDIELWKSDDVSTQQIANINPDGPSSPRGLTNVNGTLFFSAHDGSVRGRELWKSNGTTTELVKDITAGSPSTVFWAFPAAPNFVAVGDTLFFVADDGTNGQELWKSDGTTAGTVKVVPGVPLSVPYNISSITFAPIANMINYNGALYFQGDDGSGSTLWTSNGTPDGTVKIVLNHAANGPISPDDLAVSNDLLFFTAADPANGTELWKHDAASATTTMIKDIRIGFQDSNLGWLTDIGGTLFFQADNGINGTELWKSNGEPDGTEMVLDINPGSAHSYPGKPAGIGGQAYFSADDGVNGDELWISNGEADGTVLYVDIEPGAGGSSVDEPVNVAGTIFFIARNSEFGREIMAVEGAAPGPIADSTANFIAAATDRDPVNTFSGELISDKTRDLFLGGPMALYFERYYASYLRRSFILGDLGSNWRHNFDARLFLSGNTGTYISNDGRLTKFIQDVVSGIWTQQTNTDTPYQLVTGAGQDAKLYDPQKDRVYTFDFTTSSVIIGRLVMVEDGSGNTHTLTYNDPTNSQLVSISDGVGRTLTFTYNNDLIPKISVISGGMRSVSFQYTNAIDTEYLTLFTDARGGTTSYTYEDTSSNADHALMRFMTRPKGTTPFIQTFYDTSTVASGRVATQTDSDGNMFSFEYNGLETTLTDPLGGTRVHTHTATGQFSNREDQAGQSFSMGSDGTGRRNSITDRMGDTTMYAYHAPSGKLASVTHADGTMSSFAYTARPFGDLTLYDQTGITYPDGETEAFDFDANGNQISHTDQAGNIETATYNANGQRLTEINFAGGQTTYSYNADATPAMTADPAGNATIFAQDGLKRLAFITSADATTTSFTYDNEDRALTTTDENGGTLILAYDSNGNLVSSTDRLGNTSTFTYDGNDRLLTGADPLGGISSRTYDAFGRIGTSTDENGFTSTLSYDARGRLTSDTDPLGNTRTSTYDDEGIVTSDSDPLGNTTTFVSDSMGRTVQSTSPLGFVTMVSYDAMGRVISTTNALNETSTVTRDERGLATAVTLAGGTISADYARDALGNITTITDPNGNDWQTSYNNQGLRTSQTDPLGQTIDLSYDDRNRVTRLDLPGGGSLIETYDGVGNLTRSLYSDGTDLNYTYDAKDRLVIADGLAFVYDANDRITDSNGIAMTRDAGGRITMMTLAAGKTVTFTYDANDRVTQVSDWAGGTTTFAYDAADKITAIDRTNGIDTTYTYDNDSRLTGITEGAVSSITLVRDAKGQITSAARNIPEVATAQTQLDAATTYDAASQVVGSSYDSLGRLTDDGNRTYVWDMASRLASYDAGGDTVSFTYDAFGYRVSRSAAGVTRSYTWNEALTLPSISIEQEAGADLYYYIHTPGGRLIYRVNAVSNARHYYHFDETGNTLFLTDDAGMVVASYAHLPYGKLISSSGGIENLFTWQGRSSVIDETNGLYYLRARYYDSDTRRFLSRDPIRSTEPRAINPYQYALGNPLFYVDPMGSRSYKELREDQRKAWDAEFKASHKLKDLEKELKSAQSAEADQRKHFNAADKAVQKKSTSATRGDRRREVKNSMEAAARIRTLGAQIKAAKKALDAQTTVVAKSNLAASKARKRVAAKRAAAERLRAIRAHESVRQSLVKPRPDGKPIESVLPELSNWNPPKKREANELHEPGVDP